LITDITGEREFRLEKVMGAKQLNLLFLLRERKREGKRKLARIYTNCTDPSYE
jgi:hypothetical protein